MLAQLENGTFECGHVERNTSRKGNVWALTVVQKQGSIVLNHIGQIVNV